MPETLCKVISHADENKEKGRKPEASRHLGPKLRCDAVVPNREKVPLHCAVAL